MSTRAVPSASGNLFGTADVVRFVFTRKVLVLTVLFGLSISVLVAILLQTGLVLKTFDFGRFVFLAAAMFALSGWCYVRKIDARFSDSANIIGVATIALMLCGLIANTGIRVNMPIADSTLAAADAAIGLDMAEVVRLSAETPWLSSILHFAYNWSALAVVVAVIGMLAFKQSTRAWELVLTAVISMQIVAVISMFFPAKGTAFFYDLIHLQGNGIPAGAAVYAGETFDWFYHGSETVVGLADLNGVVVFPSFHTVLGLLATQALWNTKARWPAIIWSAAVIVSTVPMGGHYAVDLAAGISVWIVSCKIALWTLDQHSPTI
ncbi:phosphatase PAP2 family protein [Pontixanthobacter aestiaquae]|uniref:Inositolphosphotransferase Aur1/Ipt1 domain-containing protein n=1 Tax=Pontixanthobacter aestiaquae TaxID=1509367 RepID=A0A844Z968_9SPHN|nr:phosphatase PAP2 family protein [Pontixanthobacter aestiaquae]MDN3645613.1 phosphatase PAP2 family protein [Pontixanthobacter aestiaquae]MXO83390.1 hypothetical protein [Pontixanthobacter aestiaquae]